MSPASLSCLLLLCSAADAQGSAREPEKDASPTNSVFSSPYGHYHPLRSRSGRNQRNVEEEVEPTSICVLGDGFALLVLVRWGRPIFCGACLSYTLVISLVVGWGSAWLWRG